MRLYPIAGLLLASLLSCSPSKEATEICDEVEQFWKICGYSKSVYGYERDACEEDANDCTGKDIDAARSLNECTSDPVRNPDGCHEGFDCGDERSAFSGDCDIEDYFATDR